MPAFGWWKNISTVSIISTVQQNFKWLYYKHSTKAILKGLKNYKTRSYNKVFRVSFIFGTSIFFCTSRVINYLIYVLQTEMQDNNLQANDDFTKINKPFPECYPEILNFYLLIAQFVSIMQQSWQYTSVKG